MHAQSVYWIVSLVERKVEWYAQPSVAGGEVDCAQRRDVLEDDVIPMTCDHPAWSPRAARGVVRDPLRFRAARGMTRRCARHDPHAASSIVIGIIPVVLDDVEIARLPARDRLP
ncbi:hypothetical protein [Roseiflexus castenholzii]|uniref:hypothetical protein n=1 Tax=Roseiflexus castenholzii TaxID=120962 RepID=UPI0000E7DB0E|nr:hypothetical protein [Roseiflexus castenholzii]